MRLALAIPQVFVLPTAHQCVSKAARVVGDLLHIREVGLWSGDFHLINQQPLFEAVYLHALDSLAKIGAALFPRRFGGASRQQRHDNGKCGVLSHWGAGRKAK